jgi:hypothetical protein
MDQVMRCQRHDHTSLEEYSAIVTLTTESINDEFEMSEGVDEIHCRQGALTFVRHLH